MPDSSPAVPAQLFYSYSHKDENLRKQLEAHLSTLQSEGLISGWHDRKIGAGTEWKGVIDDHLKAASIILLLVSADFLASDYCYDIELQYAMERHDKGEARVIPVILRPCDWQTAIFAKLQALPKDAKPVTRWNNRAEAFHNVVEGIRKALLAMNSAGSSTTTGKTVVSPPAASSISVPVCLNALHQLPAPRPPISPDAPTNLKNCSRSSRTAASLSPASRPGRRGQDRSGAQAGRAAQA